jgi:NDP-sugar pyrophosphorylase family protein
MKTRLTITLSEDILKKIDFLIDKKKIRNRSHAIEHLVEQSLAPKIKTAIILAGGPEKNPYSPLTVIGTKPLILYSLDLLQKHGVRKIHIAINNQGSELKKLLGNGQEYGVNITYHHEKEQLGTAGAVAAITKKAKTDFSNEDYFVIAGDVLTNINLDELAQFHVQNNSLVTMAVKPRPAQMNYDNVFVQGNTVVSFKASEKHEIVGIVNAGVYIFSCEMNSHLPDLTTANLNTANSAESTKPSMLEKDVFPKLSNSKRVHAFSFQGIWFDVSSDQNYKHAVERM